MSPATLLYDWAPTEIAEEFKAFDLARAGQVRKSGAGWEIGGRCATKSETAGIERFEARAAAAVIFFTAREVSPCQPGH